MAGGGKWEDFWRSPEVLWQPWSGVKPGWRPWLWVTAATALSARGDVWLEAHGTHGR